MITGVMRIFLTKVQMFLDLPLLRSTVEAVVLMAAYRLPRPNLKNLEIGLSFIRTKADKVDTKFNRTKDRIALRHTLGKYWTEVPTRVDWEEKLAQTVKERGPSLQMDLGISKELGQGSASTKGKYSDTITGTGCYSLSGRVAAILDCMVSCLRKKLSRFS